MTENRQREVWIDWLRVIACFMVMVVHSTEPFYLGGEGSLILTKSDALWASFFDSLVRACVPLFIVASSYLQFPIHYPTGEFFRRRAVRILVPFVLWTCVYAFINGSPVQNFKDLLLNFNYAAGHLWFVYMLIGLYLIMPLLSPWAEKVERKELLGFIGLWLFTTFIPLIRSWASGGFAPVIIGPGDLPNVAEYPLWGEASWNPNGTFYYVSGVIGYLLIGLYFRRFVGELSWKKTLSIAVPGYLAGFAIAFLGFLRRVWVSSGGVFPVEGPVDLATEWETTWLFSSIGVALITIASILIIRKFNCSGSFYKKIVLPVSLASYGMYLAHMLVLGPVSGLFRGWLGTGNDGILGIWTTPVEIIATAIASYILVATGAVLLRKLPKIGKWII